MASMAVNCYCVVHCSASSKEDRDCSLVYSRRFFLFSMKPPDLMHRRGLQKKIPSHAYQILMSIVFVNFVQLFLDLETLFRYASRFKRVVSV